MMEDSSDSLSDDFTEEELLAMSQLNGSYSNGSDGDQTPIMLSKEQLEDLAERFASLDVNGDGFISFEELYDALKAAGVPIAPYEVRQIIEKYKKEDANRDSLTQAEFIELCTKEKRMRTMGHKFIKNVRPSVGVIELPTQGLTDTDSDIKHTIREEEQVAFAHWINSNLASDPDLSKLLLLDQDGENMYEKVGDGLIICKLINLAVPETIDERALNKGKLNAFTKRENLTLALNSAQAIGCHIVNIEADDLAKGRKHLVLGILWQIIRIGLFSQIDLVHVPGLVRLLRDGETLADLQKLSPEEILMRWVNYHMENAGVDRRLNNFTSDVMDSEIYTHLMKQIAPPERGVGLEPLYVQGNVNRAEAMLSEADKLDCRAFVTSNDVANGVYKLNLAFVANLFNTWPGLKPPGEDEMEGLEEIIEETREEKTYRNWMNSMGVQPYVNWLYSDLTNGVVIFQLYDIIRPGMVDWKKRVVVKFSRLKAMMDQIQNCNYAVELGRQIRFSLVGIQGKDLYDGNQTLTLALVWQLMRAYTLTVLAKCTGDGGSLATDKEIMGWVNQKLQSSGKDSQIRSFQDPSISDGKAVIDLIDAIQPGTINYSLFKSGGTVEDKHDNAKYAITIARKIGAKIYALPEDIVEVKPKMVMTVFACLMARDYMPNVREEASAPIGVAGQL